MPNKRLKSQFRPYNQNLFVPYTPSPENREIVSKAFEGASNIGRMTTDAILNPGSTFLTPGLKKIGVNPVVAGVAGLAADVVAPGPGEFGELGKGVKLLEVSKLKPTNAPNPRSLKVLKSLEDASKDPILVDREFNVVDGNTRLADYKRRGLSMIPATIDKKLPLKSLKFDPREVLSKGFGGTDNEKLIEGLSQGGGESRYVYHQTPASNILGIKEGGLKPGVNQNFSNSEKRVYGALSPEETSLVLRQFGSKKNVMIRWTVDDDYSMNVGRNYPDVDEDAMGALKYKSKIPSKKLEVYTKEGWKPISDITGKAQLGTILGGAVAGGVLVAGLTPSQIKYQQENPKAPIYKVRGNTINSPDIDEARKVIFSEISNRDPKKQELEARILLNTAINRMNAYREKGKDVTLSEVLQMPNQYQGYGSPQYKMYSNQATDTPTKNKKGTTDKIVDKLLKEIESGQFQDITNGAFYYSHKGDKIYYDDRRPLFRPMKREEPLFTQKQ